MDRSLAMMSGEGAAVLCSDKRRLLFRLIGLYWKYLMRDPYDVVLARSLESEICEIEISLGWREIESD